jgi:hypothetical protein
MDINGGLTILALAFGLGMLHALDADHIVAVSGPTARPPGRPAGLGCDTRLHHGGLHGARA